MPPVSRDIVQVLTPEEDAETLGLLKAAAEGRAPPITGSDSDNNQTTRHATEKTPEISLEGKEQISQQDLETARTSLLKKIGDFNNFSAQAIQYEQVIVGLGYGAFFAIWATTANRLERGQVLLAGAAMGVSLIFYIGFQLFQMVWAALWRHRQTAVLSRTLNWVEMLNEWDQVEAIKTRDNKYFITVWMITFSLSAVTGLVGALFLVGFQVSTIIQSAL